MVRTRTTARALLVLALFGIAVGTAAASPEPPPPPKSKPKPPPPTRKRIVFPVLGTAEFSNDFGAPRPQGSHEGIDILAPRHALALAAEAGKVRFYTGSSRAGCMLYLDGRSGTTYLYIHLNNDLTDGNDNRGRCVNGVAFPRGLKSGARVARRTAGRLRRRLGGRERHPSPPSLRAAPGWRTGHEPVSVPPRGPQAPLLRAAEPDVHADAVGDGHRGHGGVVACAREHASSPSDASHPAPARPAADTHGP